MRKHICSNMNITNKDSEKTRDDNDAFDEAGLEAYQQILDHCESCGEELSDYIAHLRRVDNSGQFLASTARYLAALDREKFEPWLTPLIEEAIEKDREHRYIGSLLKAIWGEDYRERAETLKQTDNNFRRIYKRLFPETLI